MTKTKIVFCPCDNKYQDKRYGKHQRVANETRKEKSPDVYEYRCTVCGRSQ